MSLDTLMLVCRHLHRYIYVHIVYLVFEDDHPFPKILVAQLDALQHLSRVHVDLPDRRLPAEKPSALVQEAPVVAKPLPARVAVQHGGAGLVTHDEWHVMDAYRTLVHGAWCMVRDARRRMGAWRVHVILCMHAASEERQTTTPFTGRVLQATERGTTSPSKAEAPHAAERRRRAREREEVAAHSETHRVGLRKTPMFTLYM